MFVFSWLIHEFVPRKENHDEVMGPGCVSGNLLTGPLAATSLAGTRSRPAHMQVCFS